MSSTEIILNRVSVIGLVVGGLFFIYAGSVLVYMHRSNPEKIPAKLAVAGSLTIFLGVLSLAFALLHFFLDGSMAEMYKKVGSIKSSVAINTTKKIISNTNTR